MTATAIKKQFDGFLPLLSIKQQTLLLEMVKSFLQPEGDVKRISRRQYNKEIDAAVNRVDKGNFISHQQALRELSDL